jgi:hypothetical protein
MLGLNGSTATDSISLSMSWETLERVFTAAQTGELERLATVPGALDADEGHLGQLMEALADPHPLVDVDLAWTENGEVVTQQRISLFTTKGAVGMVHFDRSGPAVLTIPASVAFGNRLRDGLGSLKDMRQPVKRPEGAD